MRFATRANRADRRPRPCP